MRWSEAASAVHRDLARKVIPQNQIHLGVVRRVRLVLPQIPIDGTRDREGSAGYSQKAWALLLFEAFGVLRRCGSFARGDFRFLLRAAPALHRALQSSAFVRLRAHRTRSPRRSTRRISASKFRKAKRAARARRAAPDRDRAFRHKSKATVKSPKVRPRLSHERTKTEQ